MRLPKKIKLRFATLDDVTLQPNEDGGKAVLCVAVPLTPAIAEIFGAREMLFSDKGFARDFSGSIGLPLTLSNLDMRLVSDGYELDLCPEKVRAFKVAHGTAKADGDSGPQLELRFRIHAVLERELDDVYAFWKSTNKAQFECSFNSHQEELFEMPAQPQESEPESEPESEDVADAVAGIMGEVG